MYTIRLMTIEDYQEVMALMQQTPGISLRDADGPEATARYLARNPELSFVAQNGGKICACIMSGHDGRRGYLQHLLVHPAFRRQGIASALVERCLSALEKQGILKCHIDVLTSNTLGADYWESLGWQPRNDIRRYSLVRNGATNA
jgi:ribosomal protein S18 acetylase RimI-like enzyme